MTGSEHYEEAQTLLAMASEQAAAIAVDDPTAGPPGEPALSVATALVHATLAAVYAHNRATTELTGLLRLLIDQIREVTP